MLKHMAYLVAQASDKGSIGIKEIAIMILLFIAFMIVLVVFSFGKLWLQAFISGARVRIVDLIGMWIRRVPRKLIVASRITTVKAGLDLSTDKLEAHYLAGGSVTRVIRALIAATKAGIELSFERAAAIDLAGRDVLDAVHTSVLPKVIDCPDPKRGKETVDAVAMDGIQVKAKARVTVRTKLDRLVGGATEETIIARVGEGIVTTIGSSESFKKVLENPDMISRRVLEKGLDAGTAYEILSIDIADVDVGRNIGARLQADQAEADMRKARAEAEKRRAMAMAREQEMKALVKENRAKVVLAEAEIPKAIAYAFREGKLGIFDYYRLKNIMADTEMRDAISKLGIPPVDKEKGTDKQ